VERNDVQNPIRPHRSGWDLVHNALDFGSVFGSFWLLTSLAGHGLGERDFALGLIGALVFMLLGQATGLYHPRKSPDIRSELGAIAGTWFVTTFVLLALGFLTRYGESFSRARVLAWVITAPLFVTASRLAVRLARRSARRHGIGIRRVAIAGYNRLGLEVARGLVEGADGSTLELVGFYDDRASDRLPARHAGIPGLKGRLSQLVEASRSRELDMILVTLPMRAEGRIQSLLDGLSDTTCSVYLVPDFFVFELLHSKWLTVGGLPAVSLFESPFYGVDGTVKRCLDLLLATLALAVAALPMAVIAMLIKLTSPGPVLFAQRRYGLDGREIRIWKFRSMTVCDDGPRVKQATKDDPRITPLGRVLRRTSLDELPQLFNVLAGTMSLVGPRPHATAHNEEYRKLIRGYMLRHKVKPGVTGLAQVEGCRGETDTLDKMRRRVEFDHRYIRDWSVLLDFRILRKTLWVAWRQPEAY
jgi:putative colanic acid biosynthesis UDP-glucose lipid carrier transferase